MTSKLRYKIGRQIIGRVARNRKRKKHIPNYSKSKSFLLLINSDSPVPQALLNNFKKKLNAEGKEVKTAVFFQKPKDIPEKKPENTIFVSRKDFSVWGAPKAKNCRQIISVPYDFVLNLDMEGKMPLKSLAAFSLATCRVGYNRTTNSRNFYDLSIGKPETSYSFQDFLSDIDRYLHRIE